MAKVQDGFIQLKHLGNGFTVDEAAKKIHVNATGGGGVDANTYPVNIVWNDTSIIINMNDGSSISANRAKEECTQKIYEMSSAGQLPVGYDIYMLSATGNYSMPAAPNVKVGKQFTLVHNVPTGGDIVIHNAGEVLANMIPPYGGGHTLKGFNAVATVTCVADGVYRIWGQAE